MATEPEPWVSACDSETPGRQGRSANIAGRLDSSLVQGLSLLACQSLEWPFPHCLVVLLRPVEMSSFVFFVLKLPSLSL